MTELGTRNEEPLLEVEELVVTYPRGVRAVNGASLALRRGETLGLVGTSGCGKSTLAHAALRLVEPTAGRIRAFGQDITGWPSRRLRPLRRRMQMMFQDVDGSLNPQLRAQQLIEEPMLVHGFDAAERQQRAHRMATSVGLDVASLSRRPDRFSGGQRQRLAMARALVLEPDVLVCDEPFSSLDVAVQARMVDLLVELRARLGFSVLFITHDFALARHLCQRMAVMHAGRIVETACTDDLFERPAHEQTKQLLRGARQLASSEAG